MLEPDFSDGRINRQVTAATMASVSKMPRNSLRIWSYCRKSGMVLPVERVPGARALHIHRPLRPCLCWPAWLDSGRPIGLFQALFGLRRGGRAVECTALEMRHTGNRIGGSNPSLSASLQASCAQLTVSADNTRMMSSCTLRRPARRGRRQAASHRRCAPGGGTPARGRRSPSPR